MVIPTFCIAPNERDPVRFWCLRCKNTEQTKPHIARAHTLHPNKSSILQMQWGVKCALLLSVSNFWVLGCSACSAWPCHRRQPNRTSRKGPVIRCVVCFTQSPFDFARHQGPGHSCSIENRRSVRAVAVRYRLRTDRFESIIFLLRIDVIMTVVEHRADWRAAQRGWTRSRTIGHSISHFCSSQFNWNMCRQMFCLHFKRCDYRIFTPK